MFHTGPQYGIVNSKTIAGTTHRTQYGTKLHSQEIVFMLPFSGGD